MANRLINRGNVEALKRASTDTQNQMTENEMARRNLNPKPVPKKAPVHRCMLYSRECPKGKIFTGEDAIEEALDTGDWHDTPPPVEELAQDEPGSDQSASEINELREALVTLNSELSDAKEKATAETARATAAEDQLKTVKKELADTKKKLTAAIKKAKGNES